MTGFGVLGSLIVMSALWCFAGFMIATDINASKLSACEAQLMTLAEQDVMEALEGR